jgi:hypothetical protein
MDGMKKNVTILFLFCSLFLALVSVLSGKTAEEVSNSTNIHFTGKYCTECHERRPGSRADALLKFGGDFTQLCKCHGYTPGTYIHPVDIMPSEEKVAKIPSQFPMQDGRLTCTTCHSMYLQCQTTTEASTLNPKFLRGAPYMRRTDLCFKCHDEQKYKRLDPHNQIDAEGKVIAEKCLYCHLEKPDETTATFKDIKLIGNAEVLCHRCHMKQVKFHPINSNHLLKPNKHILKNIKESEKEFGVVLPLNRAGEVTCSTCHNPHERGVLPQDKANAQGASEKYRLRLASKNLQICAACHKDKFKNMQLE